jgi:hypothetical protein
MSALALVGRLDDEKLAALETEIEGKWRARLARGSLTDFARLAGFEPAAHHRLLIAS